MKSMLWTNVLEGRRGFIGLRRAHHHGQRRGRACAPMAGEAGIAQLHMLVYTTFIRAYAGKKIVMPSRRAAGSNSHQVRLNWVSLCPNA
jgi:hypothetical protein